MIPSQALPLGQLSGGCPCISTSLCPHPGLRFPSCGYTGQQLPGQPCFTLLGTGLHQAKLVPPRNCFLMARGQLCHLGRKLILSKLTESSRVCMLTFVLGADLGWAQSRPPEETQASSWNL